MVHDGVINLIIVCVLLEVEEVSQSEYRQDNSLLVKQVVFISKLIFRLNIQHQIHGTKQHSKQEKDNKLVIGLISSLYSVNSGYDLSIKKEKICVCIV